ncbi:MAG TPA: LacI family DNA-binding transcriptional regulator [Thermoflexales bacterium]|jgi:LacI family transcriptional regulator|nr:LacI family DNA-binding transcriptional regulator [Thermoflexales bacterium]HQX11580.1 LacI family DNA-binding transcriptional regulator [Thermoflexales bacterium]
MVTNRDVAQKAGVSLATVSHVVNNTRPVSALTRQKVERAIKALDYHPSALARSLSTHSTRTIGLMVGSITLPLTAHLYRALEPAFSARGYSLVLRNIGEDPTREAACLEEFLGRRVDGILLFPSGKPLPQHAACEAAGIPMVFLNRRPRGIPGPLIELDSSRACEEATEYLVGLGHRRIALLNREYHFAPFTSRERGYRRAMRRHATPPQVTYVPGRIDESEPAAEIAARQLLAGSLRPTAIIAASHGISIGLLQAIRAAGLTCPHDLSVICFDDSSWSMCVDPPLTVMKHPTAAVSNAIVETLLAEIAPKPAARKSIIQRFHGTFVERASCGPPPILSREP